MNRKQKRKGWYVEFINNNQFQRPYAGCIEPLSILWSLTYSRYNPCYVAITIFGFGIEIGKWDKESKRKKGGKK